MNFILTTALGAVIQGWLVQFSSSPWWIVYIPIEVGSVGLCFILLVVFSWVPLTLTLSPPLFCLLDLLGRVCHDLDLAGGCLLQSSHFGPLSPVFLDISFLDLETWSHKCSFFLGK